MNFIASLLCDTYDIYDTYDTYNTCDTVCIIFY